MKFVDAISPVIQNPHHLRGGAIDVSLKGLNEQAFKESVKAVTGQAPLYEGKPRHYHFQF